MYNMIMKNRILPIILGGIAFAVFIFFMVVVVAHMSLPIDKLGEIVAKNRNGFWNGFFKVFTFAGSVYFMIGISLIVLIFDKDKKRALSVGVCLTVVGLINLFVKLGVGRSRPEYSLIEEMGKSFPSGHAMISVCFYGYLTYLYSNMKPILRCFFRISAIVIVFLLGFSRVYLGVHYVSDVIAGWCLGYVVLLLFVLVYNKIRHKK